jgi:hypothetical protein
MNKIRELINKVELFLKDKKNGWVFVLPLFISFIITTSTILWLIFGPLYYIILYIMSLR